MSGVFGDLSFDGWTGFGFENVSTAGLEQFIPVVEPLVDFAGKFFVQGCLAGSIGVPVDGGADNQLDNW